MVWLAVGHRTVRRRAGFFFEAYQLDEAWHKDYNGQLLADVVPELHQCPSTPGFPRAHDFQNLTGVGARDNHVPYLVVGRREDERSIEFGAWYGAPRHLRPTSMSGISEVVHRPWTGVPGTLKGIRDGLSHTVMVFEQSGEPDNGSGMRLIFDDLWFVHGTNLPGWVLMWQFNATVTGRRQNVQGIFSYHPGGANVARFDGSVEFLDEATDRLILLDMFGRANSDH